MSRRIQSFPALAVLAVLVTAFAIAAFAAVDPNLSRAIETQRRLTAERPDDPAVYNDLGNLYLMAEQPAEAEAAYRRAIELDPDKVTALFNLGLLQQQSGELREALRLFKRVTELQPGHAWAHYQTGTLYEHWDQEGNAIESYARAFSLDPQLAFSEVNPHIVENSLVTEAMLRAYNEGSRQPQAPKAYDEPGRIAKMLVPLPPPAAPGSETAPADAMATQPAPGAQRPGAMARPGQPGQPTVLREGDLRGGATGQAIPQGRGGRGSVRQPTQRGLRQWERPEPTMMPQPEVIEPGMEQPQVGYGDPGMQPQQPQITPPPGGVYYRPGSPSSGKLDLRVVPNRKGQTEERG